MAYIPPMVSPFTSCCKNKRLPLTHATAPKPESPGARIGLFSYLINYWAATNLPFLTILTKAGLEQLPFLSK